MNRTGGVNSMRDLARRLAEREGVESAELNDRAEKIRRTLQRYVSKSAITGRDISNDYVAAISAVMEVDPASWPAARRRATGDLLEELAERFGELADRLDALEWRVDDLEPGSSSPGRQPAQ